MWAEARHRTASAPYEVTHLIRVHRSKFSKFIIYSIHSECGRGLALNETVLRLGTLLEIGEDVAEVMSVDAKRIPPGLPHSFVLRKVSKCSGAS